VAWIVTLSRTQRLFAVLFLAGVELQNATRVFPKGVTVSVIVEYPMHGSSLSGSGLG
jgi:hypothetical protein